MTTTTSSNTASGFRLGRPLLARQGTSTPRLGDFLSLLRQRQALADLDEAALRDIGISKAEAEAESSRPLWDVPAHWRR